ncbi:glyoxylate/hydroxypyruvate reductase A [Rhodobium orientis]|uniref:Glyoxylate/hydroxypyruvate reductase A n=1 Tax=Rhodobium orientis TaxID=34017 RepID=A0A327JN26_9HYPH|nr:glyoxylate/hydroxypyruvate reductase A [Rhodobium orientis]MBB4304661.1 glyoxylate/hydroxypyruvate reductase A [Rhodobium orientis]MBK5950036.1 glyoxylate/hydroxypyruvate reductase A [Rhodobium orientis]RAI27727.1 glyoxylate/hydroxypyruvate reductase A [Rhodobium orientis]
MTVLFSAPRWDQDVWMGRIRERAPGRALQSAGADGVVDDPEAVRYALLWQAPHGIVADLPNLEVIFWLGAGVDHLMADPDVPDVPIVRVVDPSLTRRMTEWVVLQVLTHHRDQLRYLDQQRHREWRAHRCPMAKDVRVGVMGLGELGRDAAEMLRRLGYDVAGWSRSEKTIEGVACFAGDAGFGAFLARTAILVCLLPMTPATEGILNADLFSRLARDGRIEGPVVINAGRGKSQVEADIARALDDGTLAGVSLDVFETEPLVEASPLWGHPRAILTPHVAAESDPDHLISYVFDQMETFEAGGELVNVVDRTRGY